MKFIPIIPQKLDDAQQLRKLFIDILQCLKNVLESSTYSVEVVWSTPLTLQVPLAQNLPRKSSPEIVELCRAQPSDDLDTPVHFGAVAWSWQGDGSVKINDAAGLVSGVRYRLTFRVQG